jgi:hypothetical protein
MLTLEQLTELKARLIEGKSDVSDIFNDATQSIFAKPLIRNLRFAPLISKKCVFPLLMSIPFDPFLGKETETFNSIRKWTVFESPTDVMQLIKKECDENLELKRYYESRAGFKGEWDTSDYSLTDTLGDKNVLWIYRKPLIYTFPSVRINSQEVSGDPYPRDYLLDSKQDPLTGEFIGELSNIHILCAMVGNLCSEEIQSYNLALNTKVPECLSQKLRRPFTFDSSFCTIEPDSIEARNRRADIRTAYPTGSPRPLLTLIGLDFNLTPKVGSCVQQTSGGAYDLLDHFKAPQINFPEHIFYTCNFNAIDNIYSVIGNHFPKNIANKKERYSALDIYPNFCLLDYVTENTKENLTADEKKTAARDTKFVSEKNPFYQIESNGWRHPGLAAFMQNLNQFYPYSKETNYMDAVRDLLIRSFKSTTDDMLVQLQRYIIRNYPYDSLVWSNSVKTKYFDILMTLFPDRMAKESVNLIDEIQSGDALMEKLIEEGSTNENFLHIDGADDVEEDDVVTVDQIG